MAKWFFEPGHTAAEFCARHMMVTKVHGRFTRWEALVELDDDAPASWSVDATIDAASIDTWEDARDEHLRSPDF